MTNPNNAIGTNAAYSGRTSANAFNDVLSVLSRGIVSGWACSPDTGMTVVLGGDGTTRDVAIAEDNIGNRTTINNISGSPVSVTIGTAPLSNSRIDLIVAYVDNPPEGTSTITDNYEACGLIVVQGTASASPTAPNDSDIRTAITTDGGSGVTAYYVVLAEIAVASGTTVIDESLITQGGNAGIANANIQNETIEASKFAPYAANSAILTADNLTPSADTPAAWVSLLGGDGYYVTQYDTAGKFTNQPDQYGQLETFVSGTHVYQRFSQDMSVIWHRGADGSDWNIYLSGEFRLVFDDRTARIGKGPTIPTGADLNTTTYILPRDYTGTSGTYTNCPTTAGFSLTVQNIGRQLNLDATTKSASLIRILTSRNGNVWVQRVYSDSTPTWHFGKWVLIVNSDTGSGTVNSIFTPQTGFSLVFGTYYLDNNNLWLNLVVHKNSGYFGADVTVGKISNDFAPFHEVHGAAFLSNYEYSVNTVGTLYIDGKDSTLPSNIGNISIADATGGNSYARILLNYPLN